MNWMTVGRVLRDAETGAGGEGGGGSTETTQTTETQTTETQTTDTPKEEPKSLLDGEETPKEEPKKEEPKAEPPKSKNLLDDEPEPKKEEGADDTPPTEEAVKAWTDGLKAIDLGDGVKWNDEALTEMTPALMKMSGGDPKKAEGLVKAYTAYQQKVAKAVAERDVAVNNMLIAECERKFGADLKKVVGFARKGGEAIFGAQIWNAMKREPRFANNAEILEKLAEYGRKIATDTGRVVPKDGTGGGESEDVLHRMYGSVKV